MRQSSRIPCFAARKVVAASALLVVVAFHGSCNGMKARPLGPVESIAEKTLLYFNISKACTTALVVQRKFNDVPCIKQVVSKGLGVAMVVGGAVVKLPQVYMLWSAGNSVGVSLTTQYMELLMYGTPVAYNLSQGNPFSTWGESSFLVVQVVLILGLMLHFDRRYGQLAVSLVAVMAFMIPACTGQFPDTVLAALQASNIPLTVGSKIMTIMAVVRDGATGQLALSTSALNALGASARIFTTLQEVDDAVILSGWITAAVMNWAIVALFIVYPSKSSKKTE